MIRALPLQAVLIGLISTVAILPPLDGAMIILPAVPGDGDATSRWVVSAGAVPVGTGPYPGSIVVRGPLSTLLLPSLAHGALPVTARFSGCGSIQVEEVSG